MKAYVSLHTRLPKTQSDGEISYIGYKRIEVEYTTNFGESPIDCQFPEIMETVDGIQITHIAVGALESGDGEVALTVHSMPYLNVTAGLKPRIIITNIAPDGLPFNLNPIARVALMLVQHGQMDPATLHPALYEAINASLIAVGLEPIPVTRRGETHMTQVTGWGLEDLAPSKPTTH